jgi:hypothetical protein
MSDSDGGWAGDYESSPERALGHDVGAQGGEEVGAEPDSIVLVREGVRGHHGAEALLADDGAVGVGQPHGGADEEPAELGVGSPPQAMVTPSKRVPSR